MKSIVELSRLANEYIELMRSSETFKNANDDNHISTFLVEQAFEGAKTPEDYTKQAKVLFVLGVAMGSKMVGLD